MISSCSGPPNMATSWFAHDLDFGAILALTVGIGAKRHSSPGGRCLTTGHGHISLSTLEGCAAELSEGALVVVESQRRRVRILSL